MKRLLTIVAAALFATTTAASAATYKIDGLLQDQGASVLHSQRYNGDMSGYTIARFGSHVAPGGTWEDNGNISFAGHIRFNYGSGSWMRYSAKGNIDSNGGGFLNIAFSTLYNTVSHVFNFNGNVDVGPYNGFDGKVLSLWGDTGTCGYRSYCKGIDLRIAVSEVPSEVPLPASAMLLLGGLGAFAGLRRKKA